ncbi:hypothetical protein QSV34_03220 [Porticoccus sp. W117]|uniref:hypothetical protein n=1 Tax=Porticoccus sp. W117 TaxID=3054777 RepID=UPI00259758D2|nr:hypothetical protein [Porticoccus sp. W117]MDM3870360.1 hypothetical protein [Porticoccus sp. W117]
MKKDLAEFVANIAFKNSSELSKLLPLLKEQLDQDEYGYYVQAFSEALNIISIKILLKLFEEHPEIDRNIKETIQKFGKLP